MDQLLSTTIDRRRFLQGAGLAAAGTAAVMLRPGSELFGLLDRLFHIRVLSAEELTRDVVERLSGATVAVELAGGGTASLRVDEITPVAPYSIGSKAGGESFSLLMRGPADPALPQDTYTLWSKGVGAFPLFVVPVGQVTDRGEQRYEALFNRLR